MVEGVEEMKVVDVSVVSEAVPVIVVVLEDVMVAAVVEAVVGPVTVEAVLEPEVAELDACGVLVVVVAAVGAA